MSTIWYELSRDERGRFMATTGAVFVFGHTAEVALERLRWAVGDGSGGRFGGELLPREAKAPAESATSESETRDLKPSKRQREKG